jgi:hypothetical protein
MFRSSVLAVALLSWAAAGSAQSLGTFRWQTQPYCNVLTLTVTQQGHLYKLDGFDDQCGAAVKAPVSGTAVPNADGTIQFGLSIVAAPGGAATHLAVPLSVATLSGPWRDADGHSGAFTFGANTGGSARPLPGGSPLIPSAIGLLADGGFVARGAESVGTIPASGKGARAMWYPGRGVFRAGIVDGSQWDLANLGDYTVAFGENTVARGDAAVAMGEGSQALGQASVAMGLVTIASGPGSVAFGSATEASGGMAVALGQSTRASGDFSIAAGANSRAGGAGSVAMGMGAIADGPYSVALGGGSAPGTAAQASGVQGLGVLAVDRLADVHGASSRGKAGG